MKMECIVCMEIPTDVYVVKCKSLVAHTMCRSCADRWRATKPGPMTCPTCRTQEVIRILPEYMRPTERAAERTTERQWCQSGLVCPTRNKTARECSMAGCYRRVCRACVMCDSHSDF